MIAKEELKRMEDRPGFNADGTPIRASKAKKAARVADKVVSGVLRNTLGRVKRFAGRRILGRVPQEAIDGSYQEEKPKEKVVLPTPTIISTQESVASTMEDVSLIEAEIAGTIFSEYEESKMKSDEDLFNEIISGKDPVDSESSPESSPVA